MTPRPNLAHDLLVRATCHGTLVEQARSSRIPSGQHEGRALETLLEDDGAPEWVAWALRRRDGRWPAEFEDALWVFAAAYYPDATPTWTPPSTRRIR